MKNSEKLDKLNLYELNYKNINIQESQSISEESMSEIQSKNDSENISSSNIEVGDEEDDSKVCSNFVTDLFNECIKEESEEDNSDNIDNVCKDFVSNVFEECQSKKQNILSISNI